MNEWINSLHTNCPVLGCRSRYLNLELLPWQMWHTEKAVHFKWKQESAKMTALDVQMFLNESDHKAVSWAAFLLFLALLTLELIHVGALAASFQIIYLLISGTFWQTFSIDIPHQLQPSFGRHSTRSWKDLKAPLPTYEANRASVVKHCFFFCINSLFELWYINIHLRVIVLSFCSINTEKNTFFSP